MKRFLMSMLAVVGLVACGAEGPVGPGKTVQVAATGVDGAALTVDVSTIADADGDRVFALRSALGSFELSIFDDGAFSELRTDSGEPVGTRDVSADASATLTDGRVILFDEAGTPESVELPGVHVDERARTLLAGDFLAALPGACAESATGGLETAEQGEMAESLCRACGGRVRTYCDLDSRGRRVNCREVCYGAMDYCGQNGRL